MDNVSIIELPSNLGLKEPMAGQEPGVKKLPDWLRKYKFHESINPQSICRRPNAHKYWSVLKTPLKKEGSQFATNCSQLKK